MAGRHPAIESIDHRDGGGFHVWFGVRLGALRATMMSSAPDAAAASSRITSAVLDHLAAQPGRLTVDLRFRRDPRHAYLAAALLGRVFHPDRGSAQRTAAAVAGAVLDAETVEAMPLDQATLRVWLGGGPTRPAWQRLVVRRVQRDPSGRPGADWAFTRCAVADDDWDDLFASLHAQPEWTIAGVRLMAVRIAEPERVALEHAIHQLGLRAARQWNSAAGSLGVAIEEPESSFARAAVPMLDEVARQLDQLRFRWSVYACGGGTPGRLGSAFEALVGTIDATAPPRPAWSVLDVPLDIGDGLDVANQNLSFAALRSPAWVGLPPAVESLAETADRGEAAGLLRLPRFDRRPTPGFEIDLHRVAPGIPDAPFVFVSYARADLLLARAITEQLAEWRVPRWWDPRLVAGDDISRSIGRVLDHPLCRGVVVVLTEQTHLSSWVPDEIAAAMRRSLPIVQVELRPTVPIVVDLLAFSLVGWRGESSDGRLASLRDVVQRAVSATR